MKKRGQTGTAVFIALFALSVCVFLAGAVFGGKEISELENRTLTAFPAPRRADFISGAFQDALEEALGDHLTGSEAIRAAVRDGQAAALRTEQSALYALNPALESGYAQAAEGYYFYRGDKTRIVEKPAEDPAGEERLRVLAEQVNAIPDVRVYLYFIQNSRSVDFDRPEESAAVFERIRGSFRTEGSAAFTFADYEEYAQWFYQTDHHWNNRGSYRGYREIVQMMGKGEPLEAGEETEFPFVFNGSYARKTRQLCADEPFRIYSFDLPEHTVTLNGKRGKYGRTEAYLKGRYDTDPLTNHYSVCYGGEYGEIVYDFGTEGRGTLLIIANSYSNPINGLIASHFDRTTVADPRYWEEWTGEPFDPAVCAERAGADTVLLLGDIQLFTGEPDGEGGED